MEKQINIIRLKNNWMRFSKTVMLDVIFFYVPLFMPAFTDLRVRMKKIEPALFKFFMILHIYVGYKRDFIL